MRFSVGIPSLYPALSFAKMIREKARTRQIIFRRLFPLYSRGADAVVLKNCPLIDNLADDNPAQMGSVVALVCDSARSVMMRI